MSLIYSSFMGSPFVPIKSEEIKAIYNRIKLKDNDIIIDLGCGDGRFIHWAAKNHNIHGYGFDINPLLINYAKFGSKRQKINNTFFQVKNIFDCDISQANYIYFFLLPSLIEKMKLKLEKETKKDCVIISHGFPVLNWEKYLIDKITHKPFPTYYYKR